MREPKTDVERQIEAAFNYRGHVTLALQDGSTVEGYLFNREFEPTRQHGEPHVELFLKGSGAPSRVPLARIREVTLTGPDHAAASSASAAAADED